MELTWDPRKQVTPLNSSDLGHRRRSESVGGRMHYALPPHPSDPRSLFNSQAPIPFADGIVPEPPSPTKYRQEVVGEELWVYAGTSGYVCSTSDYY